MTLERRKTFSSSTDNSNANRRKHRPRPGNPNDFREPVAEPFFVTNIKVGSSLILLCSLYYGIQWMFWKPPSLGDGTVSKETWKEYLGESHDNFNVEKKEKSLKLPTFHLDDINENDSNFSLDTWDIAQIMNGSLPKHQSKTVKQNVLAKVIDTLDEMRNEFSDLYGGLNASRATLRRGLQTFQPKEQHHDQSTDTIASNNGYINPFSSIMKKDSGIFHTAAMILRAKEQKRPFKISFAGSSAVAGRGNYFKDSFPFVVQKLLSPPMQLLNIHLEVSNGAIGEVASFPYGWCLQNHLGKDANVVSWDDEMSQRRDSIAAFESYLRNVVSMDQSPTLIIRETSRSKKREELLQNYVDFGVIHDPLVINTNEVYEPYNEVDESILPIGIKDFKAFNSPSGHFGKTRTSLSSKEHELVGRLITMHFCKAIQIVVTHLMLSEENENNIGLFLKKLLYSHTNEGSNHMLPGPQINHEKESKKSTETESETASSFMSGVEISSTITDGNDKQSSSLNWKMNSIICRTSFEPTDSGATLKELVISGTTAEDIDLKLPRGPMLYNKAWVLDLSEQDKRLMKLNNQYELGYKDMKKAYFGVPASGPLLMFLPYIHINDTDEKENKAGQNEIKQTNTDGSMIDASGNFQSIIICEIKQVKTQNTCDMERDLEIFVGGQKAEKVTYINAMGAAYMGQNLCVRVMIPEKATLTTKSQMIQEVDELGEKEKDKKHSNKKKDKKKRNEKKNEKSLRLLKKKKKDAKNEGVGISLEITVVEGVVTWKGGPCTISHVVWEQRTKPSN